MTHLNELSIQNNEDAEKGSVDLKKSQRNSEIHRLHTDLQSKEKEYEKVIDMNKKVQLTFDQVNNWLHRIITKVDQQFNERIAQGTMDKTMKFKFEKVKKAIIKQLEQILMEEEEEERALINARDFMNEYATQEFLDKNIRVKPTQDLLRDADDAKTQDGGVGASRQDVFGNNIDDDDQYNKGVQFELKNEREQVKKRYEDYAAAKRLAEERARRRR